MQIKTSRFGVIEITKEDILNFSDGLLGFTPKKKFVLLDDPNDEIFAWLQSCEDHDVAFPVLEPELFCEGYSPKLSKIDMKSLQLEMNDKNMRVFTVITIPKNPKDMTANLKAPLIINVVTREARQCVLQENQYEIREPIFFKLQQRFVKNPKESMKSQAAEWGVAVKLPPESGAKKVFDLE